MLPFQQEEEKSRVGQHLSKQAISLALQGHWEMAVEVNRGIIDKFPSSVDAYNRLGRALMELGEFVQAEEAYTQALRLEPGNVIARKNLGRLIDLSRRGGSSAGYHKVIPEMFITEKGKVGIASLGHVAPREVLARIGPGEELQLSAVVPRVIVRNQAGEYLGEVESRHGLRLARLMEAGNRYIAAMVSWEESKVKVIIREVYQHPSQEGRVSFPGEEGEQIRPDLPGTLIRRMFSGDEIRDEGDDEGEEEEQALTEGFSVLGEREQEGEE